MQQIFLRDSHFPFPCVPVKQGQITVYLGALRFAELWPHCTVTPRQPRIDDPLYSSTPNPKVQAPQRPTKDERLDSIANFVEERLDWAASDRKEAIFPGTIILGLIGSVETVPATPKEDEPVETPTAAVLTEGPPFGLWLPKIAESLFIIDGQHRLKGLSHLRTRFSERIEVLERLKTRRSEEEEKELIHKRALQLRLEEFQVPISLLIDFDLAEQAMVFASVNFNQKAVSRSFYYDIFGAFESDRVTTISFSHELVLHLNNSTKSPLQDMVKLLGAGPGLVSQAFLGARLTLLIDPDHPKAVFADFFLRRQKTQMEASRQFAAIIRNFFSAVQTELHYAWPQRHEGKFSAYRYSFILCKSMAMSGLIAILGDIYRLALLDFTLGREAEVAGSETFSASFFTELLRDFDPKGRENAEKSEFARGEPWSIGGSAIVEKRIYDQMKKWLFTAYRREAGSQGSSYNVTVNDWNGARRAATIASVDEITAEEFWPKIEAAWQKLSKI